MMKRKQCEMMKNKPHSIGSVLVILMFLLTSCGAIGTKPETALWGKWTFTSSESGEPSFAHDLEFGEDGTLTINDETSTKVQYVVIAPGRLKITHNGATLIVQYELSDEKLSLVFDTGSTTYQRSPSLSEVSVAFTQESLATSDVLEVTSTPDDLPQITPTPTITNQPQPSTYFLSLPEPVKVRNMSKGTLEMFSNPLGSHMLEQDGVLWMGGSGGVTALDMATGAYKHYTVFDGLTTNTITSIALTPANEVLVGCGDGGLSKFNGNRWETFESQGLDRILAITNDGVIWATDPAHRSLGRYKDGKWGVFTSWGDLVDGVAGIGNVITSSDGSMWISTKNLNGDAILLNYQNGVFFSYSDVLPERFQIIAASPEKIVWIYDVEVSTINSFNGTSYIEIIQLKNYFDGYIFINNARVNTSTNALILSVIVVEIQNKAYSRLVILDNAEVKIIEVDEIAPDGLIYSIYQDSDNSVWIRTSNYLYNYHGNDVWQQFPVEPSIVSGIIADIAISADGSIWFASWLGNNLSHFWDWKWSSVHNFHFHPSRGGGISHYIDNKWVNYSTIDGLKYDHAVGLLLDQKGTLWVGHWLGGISSFQDGLWNSWNSYEYQTNDHRSFSYVWALDDTNDGKILAAGTIGGFGIFDGENWQSVNIDEPGFDDVRAILAAPNGDIWVGRYGYENGAKIGKLSNDEWTFYHKSEGLDAGSIVDVIDISPTGILYAGTGNGLFRFVNGRWEKIDGPRYINDIAFENDGSVWVVTEFTGVQHYKGGEWIQTYSLQDGLPGLRLQTIAISPDGSIWVGGSGGVVKITPNN
jgi:ligand-binding sensor domain-containing protein